MSLLCVLNDVEQETDLSSFLALYSIDYAILDKLSIQSPGNLDLSKRLKDYDKTQLLNDMYEAIEILRGHLFMLRGSMEFRVKCDSSINRKYSRKESWHQINRNFNDLLGLRIVCEKYPNLKSDLTEIRILDMTNENERKDGYSGIHIYYTKGKHYYPIEIQINSYSDRLFNDLAHIFTYKKDIPDFITKELKRLWKERKIVSKTDFKEVLDELLYNSKGL